MNNEIENLRLIDINNWFLLIAIKVPSGIWCFIGYDKERKILLRRRLKIQLQKAIDRIYL